MGLGALWNWWEGLDEKEEIKRNGYGKLVRESFQLSWNLGSGELMIMIFMVAWGPEFKKLFWSLSQFMRIIFSDCIWCVLLIFFVRTPKQKYINKICVGNLLGYTGMNFHWVLNVFRSLAS